MTLAATLAAVKSANVTPSRTPDGRLSYAAPRGLSDELRAALAEHKHILTVLCDQGASVPNLTRDSRPDLANDSQLWGWLLKLAMAEYGDGPESVLGALHFIRCGGAELRNEGGRLRIAPRYSPKTRIEGENGERLELATDTAWSDVAEWQRTRAEVLAPRRDAITALLRRVEAMCAEEAG